MSGLSVFSLCDLYKSTLNKYGGMRAAHENRNHCVIGTLDSWITQWKGDKIMVAGMISCALISCLGLKGALSRSPVVWLEYKSILFAFNSTPTPAYTPQRKMTLSIRQQETCFTSWYYEHTHFESVSFILHVLNKKKRQLSSRLLKSQEQRMWFPWNCLVSSEVHRRPWIFLMFICFILLHLLQCLP